MSGMIIWVLGGELVRLTLKLQFPLVFSTPGPVWFQGEQILPAVSVSIEVPPTTLTELNILTQTSVYPPVKNLNTIKCN